VITDPEAPEETTTTTTAPAAPAPVIGGFRAGRGSQACSPGQVAVVFTWSSTNATAGQLGPSGGLASAVAPSGTSQACSPPGTQWTLVVTGPGGRAIQTAMVPSF
jgi:hypothetical protein